MDTDDQPPPQVAEPIRSTAIPIAQISPDFERLWESSIHSVVTLLWPYSSSTKSLGVLLAEPDFRLRRSNGQVKVFFHGHVAEEVARTHLGIGDNVYLSLAGSRLSQNDTTTQTPGKGGSWDVHFDASAFLEVRRDSRLLATVKVNRSSATPPPADPIAVIPSTPVANGTTHTFTSEPVASEPIESAAWQSPAFLGKSRVSFGFTEPAVDPFVEEDGYVPGKGRKRPKFSMRSNEWRVIDEPESPRANDPPEDWMAMFDEELVNGSDDGEAAAQDGDESASKPSVTAPEIAPAADSDVDMAGTEPDAEPDAEPGTGPDTLAQAISQATDRAKDDAQFLRPSIAPSSIPGFSSIGRLEVGSHLPTDTPRLYPIPSPGLPDPSPLATTANSPSGYFPSTLETASGAPSTIQAPSMIPTASLAEEELVLDDSATSPQPQSDAEPTHTDEDDAVTVYTDDVQVLPDSVPNSGDAAFSPQPPRTTVATSTTIETTETGDIDAQSDYSESDVSEADILQPQLEESASESEGESENEESDGIEEVESPSLARPMVAARTAREGAETGQTEGQSDSSESDDAQANAPQAQVEESGSESEEESDSEEIHGIEEAESPSLGRKENMKDFQKSQEQPDQELEDESEDTSASSDEDERVDEKASELHKPPHVESELSLPDKSRDVPAKEHPGYNEKGVSDQDGEDPSGEGGYEDEDEDDHDGHDQDGPPYYYDYSESEGESDDEEEAPPKPAPKTAEPEIIVLDSDSEDEAPAPAPVDATKQEAEEAPDEGSYESEEESRSGEDMYDEEQPAEDESESEEEEEEDVYDQRPEHQIEEEPQVVDEDEEEDLQNDGLAQHHHEDVQTQLGIETRIPAEPALEPDQTLTSYEFIGPDGSTVERYQSVTDYPQHNHDSLDYLAAISESAERLHAIPKSTHASHDMVIDPSLFGLETPQDIPMAEPATDEPPRESPDEDDNEAGTESPGSERERNLALQLDGAAPPADFIDSAEVSFPTRHEAQQLVTPGPSQAVEIDQAPESSEALNEMLPTPNLTQDNLVKLEEEEIPLNLTETRSKELLETMDPSPVIPVKLEDESDVPERGESAPPIPTVVVDAAAPPSFDPDQQLQASIEHDESEAALHDVGTSSIDRNYPGLRSKLSYFAPLATLIDHYNAVVDTISIATEVAPPIKATSGSKDFIMTIQLTDQSMAGTTIFAQILRPYKPALPTVQEGDAILLRNFRVKSFDHSVILVSDSTSAWAVFSPSSEEPEIAGPPVEYGAEEKTYAIDLRQWYLETGLAMIADNQLQASIGLESRAESRNSSIAPSDAGSMDLALREARGDTSSSRGSRRRRSHRRITIHELRDGRRYTEVGSSPGDGSIHELRDGTVYANL